MNRKLIAGLIVSASLVPLFASALSIDGLQAQIRELLAKIEQLREQLQTQQPETLVISGTVDANAERPRICETLPFRGFSIGTRGEDVRSVQEFLRSEGVLEADATGYFGPLTQRAVGAWQIRHDVVTSANPGTGWGVLGPRTRAAIAKWCAQPVSEWKLRATPHAGQAPLEVQFGVNVQLANPRFIADAGDYKIVFGDGTEQKLDCSGEEAFCRGPHVVRHTYSQEGTYEAQLVHYGYFGLPSPDGGAPRSVVSSITIRVGGQPTARLDASPDSGNAPLLVEFTYQPSGENGQYWISFGDGEEQLMQTRQIYCITTPCISPAVASHTYARAGTYTATVSRYIACLHSNPRCLMAEPAPLASVTVRVGKEPVYCTLEYAPVCGRPIGCANTCPPGMVCPAICQLHEPQTYGNRCQLNAADATFLHEGTCTGNETF
jgi:PKD repeat protein